MPIPAFYEMYIPSYEKFPSKERMDSYLCHLASESLKRRSQHDSVFNAAITHGPRGAMVPWIKLYGTVAEASEANMSALAAGLLSKLDAARYQTEYTNIPFKNVWISEEQPMNTVTPFITQVTHGLGLQNPVLALGDVLLVCKVAEFGYEVGETASSMSYPANNTNFAPQVYVDANFVRYQSGSGGAGLHQIINRTNGTMATCTANNWRLVFRVFY